MTNNDWLLCGYKDAQEGKPYQRSPEPDPPELPDAYLPTSWQAYFRGWKAGIMDNVASILRNGN